MPFRRLAMRFGMFLVGFGMGVAFPKTPCSSASRSGAKSPRCFKIWLRSEPHSATGIRFPEHVLRSNPCIASGRNFDCHTEVGSNRIQVLGPDLPPNRLAPGQPRLMGHKNGCHKQCGLSRAPRTISTSGYDQRNRCQHIQNDSQVF